MLDIGCGPGGDSAALLESGHAVVALDLNQTSLLRCRAVAPGALLVRTDVRSPLPFRSAIFEGALASLSLHYFDWATTRRAFADIHRVLQPGSPFLFRVNADDDVNFGAGTGTQIEPGFFRVAPESGPFGEPLKRFFTEGMMRAVLDNGWSIETLRHETIARYGSFKQTWKCLARRS